MAGAAAFAVVLAGIGTALWLRQPVKPAPVLWESKYQAVLLDNGRMFYGRLTRFDTPYPELRDVYYLESFSSPDTKRRANVLVQKAGEAHRPDYMILERRHIVMVEPVDNLSKIAELIGQRQRAK